jgi:NitT/TauT family transport system permease protein
MAVRLADGSLGIHLGASAYRVGAALLVSGPAGFALGLAAGRIRGLDRVLSPFVYVFHPLPKVAFLPVIMLLAGLGDSAKIILICLVILGQLYLGARDAAREVSPAAMDSVRSLGAGPLDLLHHVILPASLPALLSSLRVALGTAVAILFFSESFASDRGMGYFIMDAWSRVDYRDMYGGVAALSLATLLVYAALDGIELLICPWKRPLDW